MPKSGGTRKGWEAGWKRQIILITRVQGRDERRLCREAAVRLGQRCWRGHGHGMELGRSASGARENRESRAALGRRQGLWFGLLSSVVIGG